MSARGFFFTTLKGNTYYYDDNSSIVRFQGKDGDGDFLFDNSPQPEITVDREHLRKYLNDNSGNQLILLITEACNIRCKYCVYSGNYTNQRSHSKTTMNLEIAKKAIEKYLTHFKIRKFKHPLDKPLVAFYGGESMLNFKLIKESVYYSNQIYNDGVQFSTTTNATLLDDDKIHFLAQNSFFLSISLNGNKDEHDRLRVFKNGSGTFNIIIKNLERIRHLYPKFYNENCQLLITIDVGSDLLEMRRFFKENQDMLPKITRISPISGIFTDWYDQYSEEQRGNFKVSMESLKRIYSAQLKSRLEEPEMFLRVLFGIPNFPILNRAQNVTLFENRPSFMPHTGACVPGEKIAVDSSGSLHICERVNQSLPIGDVDNWLDESRIINIIEDYQRSFGGMCHNCSVHNICQICYTSVLNEKGEFILTDMNPNCNNIREGFRKQFTDIWDMLEEGITFDELIPEFK